MSEEYLRLQLLLLGLDRQAHDETGDDAFVDFLHDSVVNSIQHSRDHRHHRRLERFAIVHQELDVASVESDPHLPRYSRL